MKHLSALLLPLCVAACTTTSPEEVATDNQASTVYDSCAVGENANAEETSINVGDTYTRTGAKTNTSCECKQWQAYKNSHGDSQSAADAAFPTCRPATVVDYELGDGAGHTLKATVSSWELTASTPSSKETQCKNSTLLVRLEKFNDSTGEYDQIDTTGEVNPQWSGGSCLPLGAGWTITPAGGDEEAYRIRALATIGIDADDHGYNSITVTASSND